MKILNKIENKLSFFLDTTRKKLKLSRLICLLIGIAIFIIGYYIGFHYFLNDKVLYWLVGVIWLLPSTFFIMMAKAGVIIEDCD